MKHIVNIVLAAATLSLSSCVSEDLLDNGLPAQNGGSRIDAGSTIDEMLPFGTNQLSVNVTVRPADVQTKSETVEKVDTASVEVVSYLPGMNSGMNDYVYGNPDASAATKAIYSRNTTCQLNSNFLRLDEVIDENGSATYSWDNWGRSKLLEAEVISTPDQSDDLFYRSITFTPAQAYNIRTYNDDKDTIFYHSRMVGWHPMILSVPRDGDRVAAVEFSNSRYANNRYNVTANEFGVVFDHALDGSVDLMMSNIVEAQRWHKKFNPSLPESTEHKSYNHKHFADKDQTQEEVAYTMPFGHYSSPEYANPMFYHHYLSAVRLWAVVENSDETTSMNLKTWGEIDNVSFVDQPSTAIIAIPKEASTPFTMKEDGTLEKNPDGSYYLNRQKLIWGEVISWGDMTNLNIHSDRMFGEDANNMDHDYTVQYPVDMTKDGGVKLSKTYLGYCLVKPYADYELSETEGIKLAIQTSAGIYYATIPSIASYVDDKGSHKVNMFQEGQIYDIILNLRTEGSINEFIEKENDVTYQNLSPYDTQNQTFLSANCYVIDINELQTRISNAATEGPAGYCFTGSVMGNGQRGVVSDGSVYFPTEDAVIRGATSARIVWQSKRDLISNVQLQHEYVRFIVNEATEGNAVLAVTDANGKILWSWHIWITDDPTKNPLNVTVVPAHEGIEANTIKILDRNLGALRSDAGSTDEELFSSFGLYYQWGRKDPLPGPMEKNSLSSLITPVYDGFSEETRNIYANSFGSGIEASIESPMNYMYCDNSPYYQYDWMQRPINFLWGLNTGGKIQKSIYDPCPFGYRVPQEEIQQLFENAKSLSQTDGKGVTVTSVNDIPMFFPYAGFIGSERGQYSREPVFNYVSVKGDYTSGQIYPATTATPYSYYSNHRLRTYIAKESWTEENIDGQNPFTFVVPDGKYRVFHSDTSPRDYTNRTTAATVRCVQDKSYEGKGYAILTLPGNYSSLDVLPGNTIPLTIKGGLNVGLINAVLTIQPYAGNTPKGEATEILLVDGTYPESEFTITKKTTTLIEGTYNYTYPSDFITNGITGFSFTLKVTDRENPELHVDPAERSVTFSYAHLLYQANSATAPASGKPFLTVDSGRNLTKTNEPVVGQPATLTVYVRKDVADAHGGTPVVNGYVQNDNTRTDLTFTKSSNPQNIGGVTYYEFCSHQYANDFKGEKGGTKKSSITLSFTGGSPAPGAQTTTTVNPDIKIWGLLTDYMDNRIVPRGIIMLKSAPPSLSGSKLYYLRANSDSSVGYPSTRDEYDYNNLFFNVTRTSWSGLVQSTPQGPSTIMSVRYSSVGGENRFIHFSNTSQSSGCVADLSTTATYIYFSDLTGLSGLTMYVSGSSKSGTYLKYSNAALAIASRNISPLLDAYAAYHNLYMVDRVKDPDAKNAQDLPFKTGTDKDKGDFDPNYVVF